MGRVPPPRRELGMDKVASRCDLRGGRGVHVVAVAVIMPQVPGLRGKRQAVSVKSVGFPLAAVVQ